MTLRIVTDPEAFDFDRIVPFIQQSYWGAGRTDAQIRDAIAHSAVVGLFDGNVQAGMARAITDRVFHAYIYDLFVFGSFRGRGYSHRLMRALFEHPHLSEVKGWMLSTRDAQGLYEKYGFQPVDATRTLWMRRA